MFFRRLNAKIARAKTTRQVMLTHGMFDYMRSYSAFTAFYVGDEVFRIWKDGEITRKHYHRWVSDAEKLDE